MISRFFHGPKFPPLFLVVFPLQTTAIKDNLISLSMETRLYNSFPTQEEYMIIVTGATGKLGRSIVEQLAKLVPASQVGASVRDPEKAQ